MKRALLIIGCLIAVWVLFGKRIRRRTGVVWDIHTEQRIWSLHPSIRKDAREFINRAEDEGIKLRVVSGKRSFDEQHQLYQQGRTNEDPVVTNATPGMSFHNYGLAIDVVEIKNGKGLWENPRWPAIAKIGKDLGFEWGGNWKFTDLPHFQKSFGLTPSNLLALREEQQTEYVTLA